VGRKAPVLPLVDLGDLHIGCGMAIMPRNGFQVDGQNWVMPSPLQRKLNDWWDGRDGFWPWVDKECPNGFDAVIGGDLLDGMHHQNATHWTANIDVQRQAVIAILRPIREKARRFFVIRGTETHVGASGQHEEAIARELDAEKSHDGTYSHWELYYRLGRHLIHDTHHIGTTSSPFAESGALNREMVHGYVESGRWGDEPPGMTIRHHRHTCGVFGHPSQHGMSWSVTCPAWQLKTPYGYRSAFRQQRPQVGGIICVAGDQSPYCKPWVRTVARPKEV
jgi:hypothetical protein